MIVLKRAGGMQWARRAAPAPAPGPRPAARPARPREFLPTSRRVADRTAPTATRDRRRLPLRRRAPASNSNVYNNSIHACGRARATWPAARPSGEDRETLSISGPYSGPSASPHPLSSPGVGHTIWGTWDSGNHHPRLSRACTLPFVLRPVPTFKSSIHACGLAIH